MRQAGLVLFAWIAAGVLSRQVSVDQAESAHKALEADMNEEHRPHVMHMLETTKKKKSVTQTEPSGKILKTDEGDRTMGVDETTHGMPFEHSDKTLKAADMTFTVSDTLAPATVSEEYTNTIFNEDSGPVTQAQTLPQGGVANEMPRPIVVKNTPIRKPELKANRRERSAGGMPEIGGRPRLGDMALAPVPTLDKSGEDEDSEAEPVLDPKTPIINTDGNLEVPMDRIVAKSEDGHDEMRPNTLDDADLDDDCDSPQIGEEELDTKEGVVIDMKGKPEKDAIKLMVAGSEPAVVPLDMESHTFVGDDPSAYSGEENEDASAQQLPIDEVDPVGRVINLPLKDAEDKRSKCSRFRNGNDAPDAMRNMDDDCGMPEPQIECETVGNTTLCVDRIQLVEQPAPKAEIMPPGQAQPFDESLQAINVEFADFGMSRTVMTLPSQPISRVIEEAGMDWQVGSNMVYLVRDGGMDYTNTAIEGTGGFDTLIRDLPNMRTLIVYLSCVWERYEDQTLMKVKSCEDHLPTMTASVEIPAYSASYKVDSVFDYDDISRVLSQAPVDLKEIQMITYDSVEYLPEAFNTTLGNMKFSDGSALVVYVKEPCPTQSMTPTASPSPRPSPSPSTSLDLGSLCPNCGNDLPKKVKKRKYGGFDSYRHCKSSRGDKNAPPRPDSVGLSDDVDPNNLAEGSECEESDMTDVEEGEDGEAGGDTRKDMGGTAAAKRTYDAIVPSIKIFVVYRETKVPVLIKRVAKGIDIFDAVERSTGHDHFNMEGIYMDRLITHYTPLLPFGFKDGDVVYVRDLQHVKPDEEPRLIRDEAEEILTKLNLVQHTDTANLDKVNLRG